MEGTQLWFAGDRDTWDLYDLVERNGRIAEVQPVLGGASSTLELSKETRRMMYLANPEVEADMTRLRYFHVPGILYNLKERSMANEPYTFISQSVLVAVNPLQPIEDPVDVLGEPEAVNVAHPYAIAESAYQQLKFALRRGDEDSDTAVDQSIIIGGESGAGKTTCAKMVLRHLVQRDNNVNDSHTGLDEKLMESNPILEAFGNSVTSRNHNSSRFGKFLKLHFAGGKSSRKKASLELVIAGASVQTYLLERSRVTFHVRGERNYHVFYQLIHGADSGLREYLSLEDVDFEYLTPQEQSSDTKVSKKERKAAKVDKISKKNMPSEEEDAINFQELLKSLAVIGLGHQPESNELDLEDDITASDDGKDIFGILASILHLGNLDFEDQDRPGGTAAVPVDDGPLHTAARLLQIDADDLLRSFTEVTVNTVGESITKQRNASAARFAVDAVAKTLYVGLFQYLVQRINSSLNNSDNIQDLPFIGVLDIFGFESFEVNDFEQLLINYTNEALQSCFNEQIFDAEAAIFESEGLIASEAERQPPEPNIECVELLEGGKNKAGILSMIDSEAKAPGADDERLNASFHREFRNHPNFGKIHPRDAKRCFMVKHYAGDVKYTVGSFLQKNSDALPPEVATVFAASSSELIRAAFAAAQDKISKKAAANGKKKKKPSNSVTSKFYKQMRSLMGELNTTRCSFIRCIKPNPRMKRGSGDEWLDNAYITPQLHNLSIPQTAEVLKGGLPARVNFGVYQDKYSKLLPRDVLRMWKDLTMSDPRVFVEAIFYAYSIDKDSYKIGKTMVFFKSGMLDKVEALLQDAAQGDLDEETIDRFRESFQRCRWRRILVKLRLVGTLALLLTDVREAKERERELERAEKKRREMEALRKARLERERRITDLIKTAASEVSESRNVLAELEKEYENAESPEEKDDLDREMDKIRRRMEKAKEKAKRMSISLNTSRKADMNTRKSVRMSLARMSERISRRHSLVSVRNSFRKSTARDYAPPPEDESDEPMYIAEGLEILHPQHKKSGISKLFCLVSGNKESSAQQQQQQTWEDCRLAFVGSQIRIFAFDSHSASGSWRGEGSPVRRHQVDANLKMVADEMAEDANVLIIQRRDPRHDLSSKRAFVEIFRLRFLDDEAMHEFEVRFEVAKEFFSQETREAQNLLRGVFTKKDGTQDVEKSETARELASLLSSGAITQEEYEMGLFLQMSSQDEHLHRYVTVFGKDAYQDYKIQCPKCHEILFNLPSEPLDVCPECGYEDLESPDDLEMDAITARNEEEKKRNQRFNEDLSGQDEFPFYVATSDKQQFIFEAPTHSLKTDRFTFNTFDVFNVQWVRRFDGESDWERYVMSHTWAEYRDFFCTEVLDMDGITAEIERDLPRFDMEPNYDDEAEMREDLEMFLIQFLRQVYIHDLLRIPQIPKFFGYTKGDALVSAGFSDEEDDY